MFCANRTPKVFPKTGQKNPCFHILKVFLQHETQKTGHITSGWSNKNPGVVPPKFWGPIFPTFRPRCMAFKAELWCRAGRWKGQRCARYSKVWKKEWGMGCIYLKKKKKKKFMELVLWLIWCFFKCRFDVKNTGWFFLWFDGCDFELAFGVGSSVWHCWYAIPVDPQQSTGGLASTSPMASRGRKVEDVQWNSVGVSNWSFQDVFLASNMFDASWYQKQLEQYHILVEHVFGIKCQLMCQKNSVCPTFFLCRKPGTGRSRKWSNLAATLGCSWAILDLPCFFNVEIIEIQQVFLPLNLAIWMVLEQIFGLGSCLREIWAHRTPTNS